MIGNRIKQRRVELGLTQEQLANRMGYKTKSSINKIELGKNSVTASKVAAFAKALQTTPAFLMGWESSQDAAERLYKDKIDAIVKKVAKLDESDLARLDERIDVMLEGQKYESN